MNMEPPTRLPWTQRISYGVGHSLNDFCSSMWFSYLIVYLQLVLGFDSKYAGFILLIGQTTDAIATPLLGYEISHLKPNQLCRRYGKRKVLHLIGTTCVVVSFPFLFSVCPGCNDSHEYALTILLIPLVIIFQIGWAAVQVSHLSLIPAITPHEGERDFLNVLRHVINIASDIGTYVVVWCVFDLTSKPIGNLHTIKGDYADKFLLIVLIIVAIGAFFSIVFHVGVNENPKKDGQSSEESSIELQKASNLDWRGWIREAHFYQVGMLYMLTRMFQNMSMVFMPLYLQESLQANNDFIAKIPLVMNASGFVFSCALPKFFKVLSKKLAFLLGAVLALGACAWMSFGHGINFCCWGIYIVGAMLGASSSMLLVSCLSFTHDLIGTSSESGAFVYGCMSFCDKIANGIAVMVIQYMHAIKCKNCDWFYRHIMSYGIGGVVICASIALLTLLPAKLGKRTSPYNGANDLTPKQEEIIPKSIQNGKTKVHANETTPLLR